MAYNYVKGKTGNLELFQNKQVINKTEAYLLGLIYADGTIRIDNRSCYSLVIKLQYRDKEYLRYINEILKGHFQTYPINVDETLKRDCRCGVYNKELIVRLINLGVIQRKTYSKQTFIFDNVPDELKWHFIRGYFDGNGNVMVVPKNKNYSFSFYSLNENLLSSFLKFLINQGINTKSKISYESGCYRFIISGRLKLLQFYKLLYNDCDNLYLKRKKERFEKIPLNIHTKSDKYLYKGILQRTPPRFIAQIYYNKKAERIGSFDTILEALTAYNQRAQELGLPTQEYKGEFIYVEEYEQYLASSQVDAQ